MNHHNFSILPINQINQKFLHLFNPIFLRVYYKNYYLDLLKSKKKKSSLKDLDKLLKQTYLFQRLPTLIHLSYEWGHFYQNDFDSIPDDQPLAIFIKYQDSKFKKIKIKNNFELQIKELKNGFSKKKYDNQFQEVQKNLIQGNCYQVNLTNLFQYKFKNKKRNLYHYLWDKKEAIGSYAHYTFLKVLEFELLSNSPECLFDINLQNRKIISRPIKGSVRFENMKKSWQALRSNPKEVGELDMITDLVRNDLAKVNGSYAKVNSRAIPLKVPKILHQYSSIEADLASIDNIGEVLEQIFPGGSITGAPKKNVMKIIKKIETGPRRFYCGSTVFLHKSQVKASINIRTCELSKSSLYYGSGGGVTLLSKKEDEYLEMGLKKESFFSLLAKNT